MRYRYFVELTAQVEHLRTRLIAQPGGLSHGSVDLSHAFARQLYFSAAADEALYGIWARASGVAVPAGGEFSTSATALLAQSWFGVTMPARQRLRAALAPARLLLGRRGSAKPPPAVVSAPILLFAHSLRFARFLAPLAERLGVRCAYLMAADDHATRRWAAENGHAVRLYFPSAFRWRRSSTILSRHMPGLALLAEELEAALLGSEARLVLVPEGNAPVDEIVAQVARRLGIAAVCLQQGWSPLIHTGFCNMHYTRMLVWGDGFADLLSPFNTGQIFEAVGNFHLPKADPSPRPHGLGFFCQGGGGWTSLEDQSQMIDLACAVAAELPHLPVLVRSHPVSPFDSFTVARLARIPNIRVSDPVRQSLAEMLAAVSVGVSIYSSVLLECAASGVVPVIFNITDMPHYSPDLPGMGAGLEVGEFDAAREALVAMMTEPERTASYAQGLAAFRQKFFVHDDGPALDAICTALKRCMSTGDGLQSL